MSFIRRQMGLRTDAASSTGSLHGKTRELRNHVTTQANAIKSTAQKPRGYINTGKYMLVTGGTRVTVLNITGRGKLNALGLMIPQNSTGVCFHITIDGVEIGSKGPSKTAQGYFYPSAKFLVDGDNESSFVTIENGGSPANLGGGLSFKESLKLEMWQQYSGYSTGYWQYELE